MSRRTATLVVTGLLLISLVVVAFTSPVPYAELSPGPTYNLIDAKNPVISIKGHASYPKSGHLNMTTVSVTNPDYNMSLLEALAGWLKSDEDVVEKRTVYPDTNKSAKQVNEENAEAFSSSQLNAKAAAVRHLGIPVADQVIVQAIPDGSPSLGVLHAGEFIWAVDGQSVTTPDDLGKAITAHHPGDVLTLSVSSVDTPDQRQDVKVTTGKAPGDGHTIIGISSDTAPVIPFEIDINFSEQVGGPSAGLMFAIAITDQLQPVDLTGGKFIAGTGEIDENGQVSPIGGVQMKTIAAARAGAKYFLTPKDNCADAAKTKPAGLTLVQVDSLDSALKALDVIRTGQGVLPLCHA